MSAFERKALPVRSRLLLPAALGLALALSGCAAFWKFAGDATASFITEKRDDLSNVSARVSLMNNLFPADTERLEAVDSGDTWQTGQSALSVVLLKRDGVGLVELEGDASYQDAPNGPFKPLPYMGKGSYQAGLPAAGKGPCTVQLRAKNGKVARFSVARPAPLTLKRVNGQAPSGATLDLGQDLVLELAHPAGAAGGPLKVMIGTSALGLKTLTDVAYVKGGNRVVVPHEAFSNMLLSASQDVGAIAIDQGDNVLVVERYAPAHPQTPGVGATEIVGKTWAWAKVKVTGKAPLNTGLQATGKLGSGTGLVTYLATQPNAFYGPPLTTARNVALGSLRVRGVLYEAKSTESTTENALMGTRTTTTTTTVKAFPPVPDAYWNALLQDLEKRLSGAFSRVTGAPLLPLERLAGSPTYRQAEALEQAKDTRTHAITGDEVTAFIERPLRGSRHVFPESFGALLASVSSTFGADRPISRMIQESKLGGIMSGTLDLQIAADGDGHLNLFSNFRYVLYGGPNGYSCGPTSFGQGSVTVPAGVSFDGAQLQRSQGELFRVARLPEIEAGFEAALRALVAKEREAGYARIWAAR